MTRLPVPIHAPLSDDLRSPLMLPPSSVCPPPSLPVPPGVAFFSLVLFSDQLAPTLQALGLTPLMAAVLVGAAQNVFSKSAKYSLFDPCKEMAYIPLDDEVGRGRVV